MKDKNNSNDSIDELFKRLIGVPIEDRLEIRSFMKTDRGLVVIARALTLALKLLESDYFDQESPLVIKDTTSMKVMLRVVTSFLVPEDASEVDETVADTLQKAFPYIDTFDWDI
tara:strand:+ start:1920 stop:2261 length:342 start_codon:yes stop_codon:yes gene_type:complete